MKKEYKKKKSISITIILLIGIILIAHFTGFTRDIVEKIYVQAYGEPISNEGVINNRYFNISSDGTNSKQTTEGINKAIKYAEEHNIEYLKLEKGNYLINGLGKYYQKKGIILSSNITLDLNGSTIKHEAVSEERYSLITIFEVENVKIINGIIEGDKNEHDYYNTQSAHEWGYGIELRGAKNIELSNLTIKNLIGDGIVISEMEEPFSIYKHDNPSNKIYIHGCDICENRRQGISIIDAEDVYIYSNEIHNIGGTKPSTAIDLEPNLKTEEVNKIYIYGNKFYELQGMYAIKTEGGTYNVQIFENEINGGLLIASLEEKAKISENIIKNGKIDATLTSYNSNRGYYLNNIEMKNNYIENADITIEKTNNILFERNQIIETNIITEDSNAIFINNNLITNTKNTFKYSVNTQSSEIYNLLLYNNKQLEKYKKEIQSSNKIQIIEDLEQIEQYILANF